MIDEGDPRTLDPGLRGLGAAAVFEALTGGALLLVPATVVHLLLGSIPGGAEIAVARVAGISLIALGIACWPVGAGSLSLLGMLTYTTFVGIFLASLGLRGQATGKLLWPAVMVHVALMVVLGRAWLRRRPSRVGERTRLRRRSA
jgi:hypothetical protein